jgi:hypothetical protein
MSVWRSNYLPESGSVGRPLRPTADSSQWHGELAASWTSAPGKPRQHA